MVWVIDAERWPRALLRAELIERGFDAVMRRPVSIGEIVDRVAGSVRGIR